MKITKVRDSLSDIDNIESSSFFYKNLLLIETIYSLFIYLMIFNPQDTYFLVERKFFLLNKKKVKKLKNYEIIRCGEKKLFKNRIINIVNSIYYSIKIRFKIKKFTLRKYNNIFALDHTLLGNYFVRGNFVLLEDGTINYKLKQITTKEKIKNFILGRNLTMGRDKRIKKIYLTGLATIPEEIIHKVEVINLKKLWNKKTKEEQAVILDIFDFDFGIVNILRQRKSILFTQPLYEDGILTEEEKIEIYIKILKNYNIEDIVVKVHSRETTDYKKFFPNIAVLEQKFPAELLTVLDIKFEKAITIFSTAACTLDKNIEVDFYGTEINSKIFERFGSMDSIMKRNAFIKEEQNE